MAPDDGTPKSMVRSGAREPESPQFLQEPGRPGLHAALAAVRALQGRRRSEVARKAGIKTEALADYEEGRVNPRPETLARLAATLGVPVPSLEGLGILLITFQETLQASPIVASLLVGAARSTTRFMGGVHAALSRRIDELSPSPAEKEAITQELARYVLEDLRRVGRRS